MDMVNYNASEEMKTGQDWIAGTLYSVFMVKLENVFGKQKNVAKS